MVPVGVVVQLEEPDEVQADVVVRQLLVHDVRAILRRKESLEQGKDAVPHAYGSRREPVIALARLDLVLEREPDQERAGQDQEREALHAVRPRQQFGLSTLEESANHVVSHLQLGLLAQVQGLGARHEADQARVQHQHVLLDLAELRGRLRKYIEVIVQQCLRADTLQKRKHAAVLAAEKPEQVLMSGDGRRAQVQGLDENLQSRIQHH